jgi:hypothetical protein
MSQPASVHRLKPTAPEHLAAEEAALFVQIVKSYDLRDEVSLAILSEGLTSLQRARLAREELDRDGMTFTDSKGQPKIHPLCAVERDARAAALNAFRQLNLELPRTLSKRSAW